MVTFFKSLTVEFVKEIFLTCVAFLSYTMVGISRGFTPFITSQLREPDSPIKLTVEEESWLASLTVLPDPIGCILGGIIADELGRKYVMIGIFLPFSIAWLIISLAVNQWMLYIGTILGGIASGMTYNTATYIAEMCTPKHRGFLMTLLLPSFSMGVLLGNLVVHFFGWDYGAIVFLIISVSCLLIFLFLPESPTYLIGKNRKSEAIKILSWMRDDKSDVDKEIIDIEEYYRKIRSQTKSFTSTIKECAASWKPLLIVLGLGVLQQLSGYQEIVAYTTTYFKALDIPFDHHLGVIIYSGITVIFSFLTPFLAQNCGRRYFHGYSGLGMGLCLSIAAIYETIYKNEEEKPFYWIVLIGIYGYCISLTSGVMITNFVMSGEVFKAEIRGVMCGILGSFYYIMTSLFVKFFPNFLNEFGIVVTLWCFTIFSFVNYPYAMMIIPETRGKTLNEIQEKYFSKKIKTPDSTTIIDQNL